MRSFIRNLIYESKCNLPIYNLTVLQNNSLHSTLIRVKFEPTTSCIRGKRLTVRRLPRMQEVVGSNPIQENKLIFHILL